MKIIGIGPGFYIGGSGGGGSCPQALVRGTISTLKHSRYRLLSLNAVVSKSEPVQITSVRIMGFILNLLHFSV